MMTEHPLSPYASEPMVQAWSPEWQVTEERVLWLEVLRFQIKAGAFSHLDRGDLWSMYRAYKDTADTVDLQRIERRERVTKHDVKARIEEFNFVASAYYYGNDDPLQSLELIHAGMTSADVVDNISLIRIRRLLYWLQSLATDLSWDRIHEMIRRLPFRGIKGPIGTQQDQADLLGADTAIELDKHLARIYGFERTLGAVGQVYPRSIDLDVASTLLTLPEMRAEPWHAIGAGYTAMCAAYSGDQWNEGDVSTSVVRRIALPGIFLCADAALRGVRP